VPAHSLRLLSAAALTALGLSACGGTASLYAGTGTGPGSTPPGSADPGSTSSSSSSSSTSSASTGTGPAGGTALKFTPCQDAKAPPGAMCAIFTAPLDYSNPGAGSIGMRMVKLPAKNTAQRIGSLFSNPGGPGGSGVDFVEEAGTSTFAGLNQRFDIIGWDPRGIREPSGVSHREGGSGEHQPGPRPGVRRQKRPADPSRRHR